MVQKNENGWNEYKNLVLANQEKTDERLEKIEDFQIKILTEIAKLKIKSSIWGAVGGIIPVTIMIILELIFSK